MSIPTFDEWYIKNQGASFESQWQQEGMPIWEGMAKLSRYMRDYVSEMMQEAAKK